MISAIRAIAIILAAISCVPAAAELPSSECVELHPDAMTIGQDVRYPVVVRRAEPDPRALKESGFRCGDFLPLLQGIVDEHGRVVCVRLIPPPRKHVAKAAASVFEEAVARWRFRPATKSDVPVKVIMFFTIHMKCA